MPKQQPQKGDRPLMYERCSKHSSATAQADLPHPCSTAPPLTASRATRPLTSPALLCTPNANDLELFVRGIRSGHTLSALVVGRSLYRHVAPVAVDAHSDQRQRSRAGCRQQAKVRLTATHTESPHTHTHTPQHHKKSLTRPQPFGACLRLSSEHRVSTSLRAHMYARTRFART